MGKIIIPTQEKKKVSKKKAKIAKRVATVLYKTYVRRLKRNTEFESIDLNDMCKNMVNYKSYWVRKVKIEFRPTKKEDKCQYVCHAKNETANIPNKQEMYANIQTLNENKKKNNFNISRYFKSKGYSGITYADREAVTVPYISIKRDAEVILKVSVKYRPSHNIEYLTSVPKM